MIFFNFKKKKKKLNSLNSKIDNSNLTGDEKLTHLIKRILKLLKI
jgi:hypothetical protein